MRSSGAAVFTRHNPFPPDPPLSKSHYSPSRSRKIPKQQKRLALSPVRFAEPPSPPDPPQTASLRKEDQVFHERSRSVVLCPPSSTECQLSFSESWPSTELSCSADNTNISPCSEAQTKAMRNMVAPETNGSKEPSVLAKYIERFRFGKPQSREERQHQTTDGGVDQPFWWMSTSPPSSSTPTQSSEKHIREALDLMNDDPEISQSPISKPRLDETSMSPTRHMLNLSLLSELCESSHCDQEEPEILQLQERASRLLQRSEHSLSSVSVPISSEGLGCSDFSSPVSTDEPLRRPVLSTLMPSNHLVLEAGLYEGMPIPPAVGSEGSGVRREDDILFQWRLRRKMEQARQRCLEAPFYNSVLHLPLSQTAGPNKKQSTLNSSPHQTANLSFTPVTSVSLDPPVLETTLPISSPSVSRLQPDVIREQPDLDVHPKALRQHSSRTVTNNLESPYSQSQQQQHRKQIRPRTSIPESTAEQRRPQRSSSPSPQTSDSTEEHWPNLKEKKETAGKRKTEHERREKKKNAPSSQKKKSERHASEAGRSPVRVRHSRGHEGVTRNPEKPSGKSRWQEECQSSARGGNRAPPPSPIHNALGQAVSEVLFAGSDSPTQCKTPSSSDSQAYTPPPPPQSPAVSCSGVQQSVQVIDQLMQDAEDSDGEEFEDDPLLQVLRQQRKWVKDQLREVDLMLQHL